jgi:phage-related holin
MTGFKRHTGELITFMIMFFSPVKAAILSIILLALFDFITGVSASYKLGNKITSRRMYSSIVKVTMYSTLILASHLIEAHLMDYLPMVKLATSSVALVELKSLYENVSVVLGIDLWSALKAVMDRKIETHKDE